MSFQVSLTVSTLAVAYYNKMKCFMHVALFILKCYRLLTPISTNLLNNYQHVSSWLTVNDNSYRLCHLGQVSCVVFICH